VDKEAALAPLDYIDVEVTAFPKGHGAIATSWSLPTSECSLHSCFWEADGDLFVFILTSTSKGSRADKRGGRG